MGSRLTTKRLRMMSLFIPKVFMNISREQITEVFNHVGKVDHIDLIPKVDARGLQYNTAYVHFEFWHDTVYANNLHSKLEEGVSTKVVYDAPWFWLVFKNKSAKKPYERKQCVAPEVDESFGDVDESYEWVDAKYASCLEKQLALCYKTITAMQGRIDVLEGEAQEEEFYNHDF